MPADLPHWRTVYDDLHGWQACGATERMYGQFRDACRIAARCRPGPTAAVIDSQSVRAAEEVSRASRGYDKGPEDLHTFKVLPRRWVVERTLAWITRHRRTVRDCERLPTHHETMIYWA